MATRCLPFLISVPLLFLFTECIVVNQEELDANQEILFQTQSIPSASPSKSSGSGQWQGNLFVGQVAADDTASPRKIDLQQRQNVTIKNGTRNAKHEHDQHRTSAASAASRRYDAASPPAAIGSAGNTSFRILEGIYGRLSSEKEELRRERLQQMNLWLSEKDATGRTGMLTTNEKDEEGEMKAEPLKAGPFLISPMLVSPVYAPEGKASSSSSTGNKKTGMELKAPLTFSLEDFHSLATGEDAAAILHHNLKDRDVIDRIGLGEDETDADHVPDEEDNHQSNQHSSEAHSMPVGTGKTPPCGSQGRFYCSYKEDYPNKVIGEVSKYYKWPLEKLFRDLRQQVMPKLANDNYGGLVCDSLTRVVRPGWARNTNNRWLVVINTDHYQQFVTEVICRNGPSANCNFIPPCYQATCAQRYNTQKLLVIDPWNPYKGPFVSEFLFPSCCICYVPSFSSSEAASSSSAAGGNRRMDKTPYADRRTSETSTVKIEL